MLLKTEDFPISGTEYAEMVVSVLILYKIILITSDQISLEEVHKLLNTFMILSRQPLKHILQVKT